MTCTNVRGYIICHQPDFKPGDPAPDGYLAWHEWAGVQHKAGLKQKACDHCGKFKYPQELSDRSRPYRVQTATGDAVWIKSIVCNDCASITPSSPPESKPSD